MEIPENSYCRLCAQCMPVNLLYKIKYDRDKSLLIMNKLKQLKENFISLFVYTKLPDTICVQCLECLDKSVEFIQTVERSQSVLEQIFSSNPPLSTLGVLSSPHYTAGVKECQDSINTIEFKDNIKKEGQIKNEDKLQSEFSSSSSHYEDIVIAECLPDSDSRDSNLTWVGYQWTCALCASAFSIMEDLRDHSMSSHQSCSQFRCSDCNTHIPKYNNFIAHVLKHRTHLVDFCPICNINFEASAQDARSHRACHLPHANVCDGCNQSFASPEKLKDHNGTYRIERRNKEKRKKSMEHPCRVCDKVLKTRVILQQHMATHARRSRDYMCDVCGKSFYNKDTLAGHFRVHTDERPHACKICNMSFKGISNLRKHVKTHSQARPYTCEVCGKCYKTETQIKSHSLLHTEEPKFVCEICEKRFRAKTVLLRHYRQHTGDKPYSCDKCGKTFADRSNFGKHIKRRHGVEIAKKKYTPKGFFPINPATGQPEIAPPAPDTEDWKRRVFARKKSKRKKPTDIHESVSAS